MSGSSGRRSKRETEAEVLRLDDKICPHCGRELQAEWDEFPPALQKKYGKRAETGIRNAEWNRVLSDTRSAINVAKVGALTAGTVQAADPKLRGATMGLHSMCGYAGGFIGPLGVGTVLR